MPQPFLSFPEMSTSSVFHNNFIGPRRRGSPPGKNGGGGDGPPPPWNKEQTCSNDHNTCKDLPHNHSYSISTPSPSRSQASPTRTSSKLVTPSPIPVSASPSVSESTSTLKSPSTSIGSQPLQNTRSSHTTKDPPTTTTSLPLSSSRSFPSTGVGVSPQPGLTPPSISISLVPTPTYLPSLNSGLSAGAAVGLALGVFVVLLTLVAAVLLLFLRRRRRIRSKRDSANSDSSRRQLTYGDPPLRRSFGLSSISSWFGSVPVWFDRTIDPRYVHSRANSFPHEDRLRASFQDKRASDCSSPLGWPIPMPAPPARILSPRLMPGFLGTAGVDHRDGLTPAPRPKPKNGPDTLLTMAAMEYPGAAISPHTTVPPSRGAGYCIEEPLDFGDAG